MKMSLIKFACAALAFFVLFACNDIGTNANDNEAKAPPSETPYDPYVVLISPAVKEWMDEQFASGKNDRRDIYVSDMQRPTRATAEPTVQCSSGGGCIVNGKSMSHEEYSEFRDKFERENPLIYRELDIPGEIIYGYRSLMTASEIEELAQRYTEIAIEFYIEPQNDDMPEIYVPAMNSNVVSYRSHLANDEYTMQQLGEEWYRHGFVTDKEILKIWFPHIFNGNQAKEECNYFALHFIGSSSGLVSSYEVLSQDMALSRIACTWKGTGITTADFAKRAMLICDDKDWKLKESIDLDDIKFYNDPNWECESGAGSPNWEEIYF